MKTEIRETVKRKIEVGDMLWVAGHKVKVDKLVDYPERCPFVVVTCVCCDTNKFSMSCNMNTLLGIMDELVEEPIHTFQPFNLVIETLEDAKLLWNILNCPSAKPLIDYNVTSPSYCRNNLDGVLTSAVNSSARYKLWDLIDTQLQDNLTTKK